MYNYHQGRTLTGGTICQVKNGWNKGLFRNRNSPETQKVYLKRFQLTFSLAHHKTKKVFMVLFGPSFPVGFDYSRSILD